MNIDTNLKDKVDNDDVQNKVRTFFEEDISDFLYLYLINFVVLKY